MLEELGLQLVVDHRLEVLLVVVVVLNGVRVLREVVVVEVDVRGGLLYEEEDAAEEVYDYYLLEVGEKL